MQKNQKMKLVKCLKKIRYAPVKGADNKSEVYVLSKLYNEYNKLKEKNNEKIYIFKSGMFYLFLGEDAIKISEIFGFKVTKLNESVQKCGFPVSRLEYYINMLKSRNIEFEIIDGNYSKIENYEDYINNNKLKEIIDKIMDINMDNITFREAYDLLEKFKLDISNIYKGKK